MSMSVEGRPNSLSLREDQVLQRVVAQKIIRGYALSFKVASGDTLLGFVTGLDEFWIQIWEIATKKLVLLHLANIVSVSETDTSIRDLDNNSRDTVRGFQTAMKFVSKDVVS